MDIVTILISKSDHVLTTKSSRDHLGADRDYIQLRCSTGVVVILLPGFSYCCHHINTYAQKRGQNKASNRPLLLGYCIIMFLELHHFKKHVTTTPFHGDFKDSGDESDSNYNEACEVLQSTEHASVCPDEQLGAERLWLAESLKPGTRLQRPTQKKGLGLGTERVGWASWVSSITVYSGEASNSARELHLCYKMFCT